jgi:hypothetical protein
VQATSKRDASGSTHRLSVTAVGCGRGGSVDAVRLGLIHDWQPALQLRLPHLDVLWLQLNMPSSVDVIVSSSGCALSHSRSRKFNSPALSSLPSGIATAHADAHTCTRAHTREPL